MKYSLMSLTLGNLIKVTKPSFLQVNMARAMGLQIEDPTLDQVLEFLAGKGFPAKKGTMTFEDCIKFAKETGFDGYDMMCFHLEGDGAEAKKILEKYDFQLSGVAIIVEFANAMTPEEFDKCFAYAKEHMDRAAAAGAKNVMLVPTTYTTKPGISREQATLNMIAGFKACIEYAESVGLEPNAETLESSAVPLSSATEMQRYFDAFPQLKYSHDTGNLLVANEDPAEMYEKFKDRVVRVHFKDMQYSEKRTPSMTRDGKFIRTTVLGTGLVDFKEQLRLLKRDNFQGFVLLEGTVQHTDDVLEDARKTLEYFRNLEKEV